VPVAKHSFVAVAAAYTDFAWWKWLRKGKALGNSTH